VARVREADFPRDLEAVRTLFGEYAAGLGIDLCFQGFEAELAGLPGRYARPAGGMWIAEGKGEAAGCVALRALDDGACEMKRLYVRPAYRGTGVGRALAERSIEHAQAAGYSRMLLDTLATMDGAIRLYRSLGFAEVEAYYHNPTPGAIYFARTWKTKTRSAT
jgi:putative acetyltransferase